MKGLLSTGPTPSSFQQQKGFFKPVPIYQVIRIYLEGRTIYIIENPGQSWEQPTLFGVTWSRRKTSRQGAKTLIQRSISWNVCLGHLFTLVYTGVHWLTVVDQHLFCTIQFVGYSKLLTQNSTHCTRHIKQYTKYTLHTIYYKLPKTYYTLNTTHYTLHTKHYTLHTTHYTLHNTD